MPMPNPNPPDRPLSGLLQLVWRQPLWAIPFALFFGLLNEAGRGPYIYVLSLKVSIVFSYAIGLGLWFVHYFVRPRIMCESPEPGEGARWRVTTAYVSAAIVGSYVAAFIVHATMVPGFLGSARSVLLSGLFTLIFSTLFAGISVARVYYRVAVERARAVETMRAELAEAELRALRAQINPHFLFNTLNSIAALIRIDPAAAEATTTRLADVFRYTLRASDATHTRLGDELAFVREYLAIERTRFSDRLRVTEDIEPGLEDLAIPGLLLQPLVENAVRYAVSPRTEGGSIRIGARRDGDRLRLTVTDDGPGLSDRASASGNGFGLHSVRERLRAGGPPHELQIRTAPGHGTEVEVILPVRPNGESVRRNPNPSGGPS
jgi:two-component sensor histidine kinase